MSLIEKLQMTRDQTLSMFALEEEKLSKSYGEDKWTIKELLHHITDAETVLYDRIRRCISNPDQVVWGFDQEAWAKELKYQELPLEMARPIYTSVREMVIFQARRFYHAKGDQVVIHSKTGKRTLKDLFEKVVWHNEMHLKHIEKALADSG